uniref:Uncharacterized protein n=1 Tax=Cucumis sativus TaxID=3659 RepID=A0A0A0KAW7_CUCSA
MPGNGLKEMSCESFKKHGFALFKARRDMSLLKSLIWIILRDTLLNVLSRMEKSVPSWNKRNLASRVRSLGNREGFRSKFKPE